MTNRDIDVIGGSAGSVDSVAALLAGVGPRLPASICVSLHLAPTRPAWLSTRFARVTGLTIESPGRELSLEPHRIYIAKPDHHLVVKPGKVVSVRGPHDNLWRPAIDVLFRTAAVAYGN